MKYDFDKPVNRSNTNSFKWDKTIEFLGSSDVIPLWVADMDLECSHKVVDALRERLEHNIFGYTYRPNSFYQAIIDWNKKRFNWKIKKDWILNTPGVVTAIAIALQTFSQKGDKILIQPPVYGPFHEVVEINDRKLIKNNLLLKDNKYCIDFADLEEKLAQDVKIMLLCSPHNPVGRVWTKDELHRIGEMAKKYDVLIVSDEIHYDFVLSDVKHYPLAKLSTDFADRIITLTAPSKTFNLAGFKMANVIISNRNIYEKFNKGINKLHLSNSTILGVIAEEAAYRYGEEWLEQVLEYIRENQQFVTDYIQENIPKIKVIKGEGTFLLWLDFREFELTHEELKKLIINKAKVGLFDGKFFGESGAGFFRMNLAVSRKVLEKALDNLKRIFVT